MSLSAHTTEPPSETSELAALLVCLDRRPVIGHAVAECAEIFTLKKPRAPAEPPRRSMIAMFCDW